MIKIVLNQNYIQFFFIWSRDSEGNISHGMPQQASNQQHQHHTMLSQTTHFVNGPFPATLQVC